VISSKRTRLGAEPAEAQTVSYQNRRFIEYLREKGYGQNKRKRESMADSNDRPSKKKKE